MLSAHPNSTCSSDNASEKYFPSSTCDILCRKFFSAACAVHMEKAALNVNRTEMTF